MAVDEDSNQNLDLLPCWKHQHGRFILAHQIIVSAVFTFLR